MNSEELDAKILELQESIANGDHSRVTELRLQSFLVLKAKDSRA